MRRVVIAAAAVAVLGVAGCGGESEPERPEAPDAVQEETDSTTGSSTEQWESSGELDNMPAEAAAELPPLVDAQTVLDAFTEAGLSDGESSDLGAATESCDLTDCVQIFTTGEVTVMLYVAEEMAASAAEWIGEAHTEGGVVLDYAASETPENARADYEAALAEAVAG